MKQTTLHQKLKAKDLLRFQGSTRLRQGKAFFCGGPEPRKTSPGFVGNNKKYLKYLNLELLIIRMICKKSYSSQYKFNIQSLNIFTIWVLDYKLFFSYHLPRNSGLVGGIAASTSSQIGPPKSLPKTRPRKFKPTQRLCCFTTLSYVQSVGCGCANYWWHHTKCRGQSTKKK